MKSWGGSMRLSAERCCPEKVGIKHVRPTSGQRRRAAQGASLRLTLPRGPSPWLRFFATKQDPAERADEAGGGAAVQRQRRCAEQGWERQSGVRVIFY